jgi:hypothetical protein
MPPEVRRYTPKEQAVPTDMVCLQLDSDKPFDVSLFDRLVQPLAQVDEYGQGNAKWIVKGEKMYFFNSAQHHDRVNEMLESQGDVGKVEAAGLLVIFDLGDRSIRTITDYSPTLADSGVLSRYNSDTFKMNILENKLNAEGKFFTVKKVI